MKLSSPPLPLPSTLSRSPSLPRKVFGPLLVLLVVPLFLFGIRNKVDDVWAYPVLSLIIGVDVWAYPPLSPMMAKNSFLTQKECGKEFPLYWKMIKEVTKKQIRKEGVTKDLVEGDVEGARVIVKDGNMFVKNFSATWTRRRTLRILAQIHDAIITSPEALKRFDPQPLPLPLLVLLSPSKTKKKGQQDDDNKRRRQSADRQRGRGGLCPPPPNSTNPSQPSSTSALSQRFLMWSLHLRLTISLDIFGLPLDL